MALLHPKVDIRFAAPPPYWERRVIFFSNIHSIFYGNVEETAQLMNEITGSHSYGNRVVSILNLLFRGSPNVILLETPASPSLMRYLTDDLGLSLPESVMLDADGYGVLAALLKEPSPARQDHLIGKLQDHPAEWVDGFVTDAKLVEIAEGLKKRTISSLAGSKNGNNKYLLYRHQLEKGLPVFDTVIASDLTELNAALDRLRAMGYGTAVVKAQIGASGYGMLKIPTVPTAPEVIPQFIFFEGPCMVQGWIEDGVLDMKKLASPSVQLFLTDETIFLFDLTEQILSGDSVHQGNISPPPVIAQYPEVDRQLRSQATDAALWLHEQGYRGTASADFLIVERQARIESILCEINARVTGATYPALLARHYNPSGEWLMRNIGFRKPLAGADLLNVLEQSGVLYRPDRSAGMIPFNFNTDLQGKVLKGQFVCIGNNTEECTALLTRAWSRLPVEWDYERD